MYSTFRPTLGTGVGGLLKGTDSTEELRYQVSLELQSQWCIDLDTIRFKAILTAEITPGKSACHDQTTRT